MLTSVNELRAPDDRISAMHMSGNSANGMLISVDETVTVHAVLLSSEVSASHSRSN